MIPAEIMVSNNEMLTTWLLSGFAAAGALGELSELLMGETR